MQQHKKELMLYMSRTLSLLNDGKYLLESELFILAATSAFAKGKYSLG